MSDRKNLSLEDLIYDIRIQLGIAESSFLEQRGWTHTSSTPDYVWRWVKTMDDGTKIMVRQIDALSIEGLGR